MSATPVAPARTGEPACPSDPTGSGRVVTMRDGLPGFESCRRFVVMASPDLDPLVQLQGLDGSRPSFLALDPRRVCPDYETVLSAADRQRLGASPSDVLLWLALVQIDGARVRVNLRAPVVINPGLMQGLQVIAADSPYLTDHELPVE